MKTGLQQTSTQYKLVQCQRVRNREDRIIQVFTMGTPSGNLGLCKFGYILMISVDFLSFVSVAATCFI
jgi:hypothetical protein